MYHIIINPASRSGKGQKGWEKAEPLFRESGEEYEAHFSTEEKGIRDIVRELTEAAAARRREALQEQPPEELLPPDRFWAVWEAPERPEDKTDLIIMASFSEQKSRSSSPHRQMDSSRMSIVSVPDMLIW